MHVMIQLQSIAIYVHELCTKGNVVKLYVAI